MRIELVSVVVALIALTGSAGAESPKIDYDRYVNNGKTLICGVDWNSGRWTAPVGVLLSNSNDSRWIGWVHFRVYDIAPLEFSVTREDRFNIVMASNNVVLVLNDLDIRVRILNEEAETVDIASGHCRTLDQERFSVTVEGVEHESE